MVNDPVSDMLIRIVNAQKAGKNTVLFSYSKFKHEIAKALARGGYLVSLDKKGRKIKKNLEITLNPQDNPKAINKIKLFSKPSRRLYVKCDQIRSHRISGGLVLISTSKGVMTDKEASMAKLGGQLIAGIW